MESETNQKVEEYLKLLGYIKNRVEDEQTAVAIFPTSAVFLEFFRKIVDFGLKMRIFPQTPLVVPNNNVFIYFFLT